MAKILGKNDSFTALTAAFVWPSIGERPSTTSHWEKVCRLAAVFAVAITPLADIMQSDNDTANSDKTTTSSGANTNSSTSEIPLSNDWMIAGYGGAPHTYASDVRATKEGVRDFTVKDVAWDGMPFKSPIYYGVRIVRWAGEGRFGAMLDFTHSKTIARLADEVKATGQIGGQPVPESGPLNALFERLEFSHGHNMLSVNGLVRLGRISTNVLPYVGLGAGVNLPHSEVQVKGDAKRSYEYQYTGPMAQGLIGLEFRMAKVSYFVEYKFTMARYLAPLVAQDGTDIGLFGDLYRQFKRWSSGAEPADGWVSTDLNSHQAIAGIGVRIQK